jgi:hypothetical protein
MDMISTTYILLNVIDFGGTLVTSKLNKLPVRLTRVFNQCTVVAVIT